MKGMKGMKGIKEVVGIDFEALEAVRSDDPHKIRFRHALEQHDAVLDELYPPYKLRWKILKKIKFSHVLRSLYPRQYAVSFVEGLMSRIDDLNHMIEDDADEKERLKDERDKIKILNDSHFIKRDGRLLR